MKVLQKFSVWLSMCLEPLMRVVLNALLSSGKLEFRLRQVNVEEVELKLVAPEKDKLVVDTVVKVSKTFKE